MRISTSLRRKLRLSLGSRAMRRSGTKNDRIRFGDLKPPPNALKTKPRVLLMSRNAVPNVVGKIKHSGTEIVATARVPRVKCSLPYAPIVAKKLKYRSNHAKTDQCIAVIATVKKDRVDNIGLI